MTRPIIAYLLWSVMRPVTSAFTAMITAGLAVWGATLISHEPDGWRLAIMAGGCIGLLVCLACVVYDGETIRRALIPIQPADRVKQTHITLTDPTGQAGQFIALGDYDKLKRLADIAQQGDPLTFGYLVEGIRLYRRGEWELVRTELIKRGLAVAAGRGGLALTGAGRAVIRHLSPTDRDVSNKR